MHSTVGNKADFSSSCRNQLSSLLVASGFMDNATFSSESPWVVGVASTQARNAARRNEVRSKQISLGHWPERLLSLVSVCDVAPFLFTHRFGAKINARFPFRWLPTDFNIIFWTKLENEHKKRSLCTYVQLPSTEARRFLIDVFVRFTFQCHIVTS